MGQRSAAIQPRNCSFSRQRLCFSFDMSEINQQCSVFQHNTALLVCRTIEGALKLQRGFIHRTLGRVLGCFFLSFCWILFAWTRSFSSSGWLADGHLKERCSLPGINSVWSFSSSYCCTTSAPWHREQGDWSLYWLRMRRHEHNESTDRSYTALLGVNLPVWSTGAWRVKNKIQRLSVRHRDQIHMPLQPTHSGWEGEEPGGVEELDWRLIGAVRKPTDRGYWKY